MTKRLWLVSLEYEIPVLASTESEAIRIAQYNSKNEEPVLVKAEDTNSKWVRKSLAYSEYHGTLPYGGDGKTTIDQLLRSEVNNAG